MKLLSIILSAVFVLTLLTGCDWKPRVGSPFGGNQKMLFEGPPGPPNFKQGWKDGCETGISATANQYQKMFYKFKQDSALAQDPTYYTGWKTAFDYCQRYMFQYLKREFF